VDDADRGHGLVVVEALVADGCEPQGGGRQRDSGERERDTVASCKPKHPSAGAILAGVSHLSIAGFPAPRGSFAS